MSSTNNNNQASAVPTAASSSAPVASSSSAPDDAPAATSVENSTSWINVYNADKKSSNDTLVEWMLTNDNYARFIGPKVDTGEARPKNFFLDAIIDLLVATGHAKRKRATVNQQIRRTKKNVEEVRRMLSSTGFGVDDP